MNFSDFCGPSYSPRSVIAESQRTVNWYTERLQSDKGKAPWILKRSPGLRSYCPTGINGVVRGGFSLNGHVFFAVGDRVIEVLGPGSFFDRSAASGVFLVNDNKPVYFAGNPEQLMCTSGGHGYILQFATMVEIASGFPVGDAGPCTFIDGYFVVAVNNSQLFQISALNDGTVWDASQISSVESRPDFLVMPYTNREDLWMLGTQTAQVFYDNGNVDFPFVPNQSAVSQQGCIAPASVQHLGDVLIWLGGDDNGQGVVYKANGYAPVVASNYAVEAAIQTYGTISDAIGMGFQMDGHWFYRLYFPLAAGGSGRTWQLDLDTGDWTEVSLWNQLAGIEEAHLGRVIVSCFGKILVGSRVDGTIYDMSMDYLDDAGTIIRRLRRAPHLYSEKKQIIYHEIGFDGNTGIGLNVASTALGYDPQFILNISRDGGKTWPLTRQIRAGKVGEYSTMMRTFNVGVARDLVIETVCTDPVDWMIDSAWLNFSVLTN